MICKMGGWWQYNCCFVGCCFHHLFKTVRNILVYFPFRFFSMRFMSVHVMHPNGHNLEESRLILSDRLDFHWIDSLFLVFLAFARRMLTSLSVDGMLLLRYWNWCTNFRVLSLKVKITSFLFKTHVLYFTGIHVEANASCYWSTLYSRVFFVFFFCCSGWCIR